jgi:alcohol dehydrogenase (cytochrome c)
VEHGQLRFRTRAGLLGTAQAKPWVAASRGLTVEDAALYSNSTLAIDPDDGSIAWYRQHVPWESLDLDEVFERILIDRNEQRLVFPTGKHGILWKLNRENGEFISHLESIYQNVFDYVDPQTGAVRYREDPRRGSFVGGVRPLLDS